MTIKTSSLGGGGALPRLAPDLTFPSDKSGISVPALVVVPVTPGVLTTTLSLTGKFDVGLLTYSSLVAEAMTHKLTIDGVVIWNDVGSSNTSETLLDGNTYAEHIQCNSSLLLEINTLTDASVTLNYLARPIL